jgi:uncharacterized damage-inducible protein DinB
MKLAKACSQILDQLRQLVEQIEPTDYIKQSPVLNGSTIGQHLRHTIEFFLCFQDGFSVGVINYDKRSHDKLIENDKFLALKALREIAAFVNVIQVNKPLKLEVAYDTDRADFVTIETNAQRELVYNIEHAVHHMAIMKIGIRDVAAYVKLPFDFGIAASTIRHQTAHHQAAVPK